MGKKKTNQKKKSARADVGHSSAAGSSNDASKDQIHQGVVTKITSCNAFIKQKDTSKDAMCYIDDLEEPLKVGTIVFYTRTQRKNSGMWTARNVTLNEEDTSDAHNTSKEQLPNLGANLRTIPVEECITSLYRSIKQLKAQLHDKRPRVVKETLALLLHALLHKSSSRQVLQTCLMREVCTHEAFLTVVLPDSLESKLDEFDQLEHTLNVARLAYKILRTQQYEGYRKIRALRTALQDKCDTIIFQNFPNMVDVLDLETIQPTKITDVSQMRNRVRSAIVEVIESAESIAKKFQEQQAAVQLRAKSLANSSVGIVDRGWLIPLDLNQFRRLALHPTREEVRIRDPHLRPLQKSYSSIDEYLDVMSRLLRCDAFEPLQQQLQVLKIATSATFREHRISLYQNTCLIDREVGWQGLSYCVLLDRNDNKLRNRDWQVDKSLKFGSLLCFAPRIKPTENAFIEKDPEYYWAIVSDRDPAKLRKNGMFWVQFLNHHPPMSDALKYDFIESPVFFVPYRYSLKKLASIEKGDLPFQDILLGNTAISRVPEYLSKLNSIRVSCVYKGSNATISAGGEFPAEYNGRKLELEASQKRAVELALSNEVAIVQGPPGTGKTFTTVKITNIILENIEKSDLPIVVICYTNHALDQFLERLLDEDITNIARLGSRTKSKRLEDYLMGNLSQQNEDRKTAYSRELGIKQARATKKTLASRISNIRSELRKNVRVPFEFVEQDFPLMADQIIRLAKSSRENELTVYSKWLGASKEIAHAMEDAVEWQYEIKRQQNQSTEANQDSDETDLAVINGFDNDSGSESDSDSASSVRDSNDNSVADIKTQNLSYSDAQTTSSGFDEDRAEWLSTNKKLDRNLQSYLSIPPVDYSVAQQATITNMDFEKKWAVHNRWLAAYREKLEAEEAQCIMDLDTVQAELQELLCARYAARLRGCQIVGCTSTYAASSHSLLASLNPKVMIFEEAAELLEMHLVASLQPSLEHLIMIGDHQQLRPKNEVYELANRYNMCRSLFERLINIGHPNVQLKVQRRMRPEISSLVRLVYPALQDHDSTFERPHVHGMGSNIYLVKHSHPEEIIHKSRCNHHEADWLAYTAKYLLQQEYSPKDIVCLTPYTGQLRVINNKLLNLAKKSIPELAEVRVRSIDDFQGEESEIILLSLVRSHGESNSIGFLKQQNRVNVAFSRARKGFFIFANIDFLRKKSEFISQLNRSLEVANCIGTTLPVVCQTHGHKTNIDDPAKFSLYCPQGGCMQECRVRLPCGHACQMACHAVDHSKFKCHKPCQRPRPCGHICNGKRCHQHSGPGGCGACMTRVNKTLQCGHEAQVKCGIPIDRAQCKNPCSKLLRCGHSCPGNCSDRCEDQVCKVLVQKKLQCGHYAEAECHTDETTIKCTAPCKTLLECEHKCSGTCYECRIAHKTCSHPCGRQLVCSHFCTKPCTKNCPPCDHKCETSCIHSKCTKTCFEPCVTCNEPCAWKCKHLKCTKLCHEPCDRPRCNEPCTLKLLCGHQCIGVCGEKCPDLCRICNSDALQRQAELMYMDDDIDTLYLHLDCGHIIDKDFVDGWVDSQSKEQSVKPPTCPVPVCKKPLRHTMRYTKEMNKFLLELNVIKETQIQNRERLIRDVEQLKQKIENMHKKYAKKHDKHSRKPDANDSISLSMHELCTFENVSDTLKATHAAFFLKYSEKLIQRLEDHSKFTSEEVDAAKNQVDRLDDAVRIQALYTVYSQVVRKVLRNEGKDLQIGGINFRFSDWARAQEATQTFQKQFIRKTISHDEMSLSLKRMLYLELELQYNGCLARIGLQRRKGLFKEGAQKELQTLQRTYQIIQTLISRTNQKDHTGDSEVYSLINSLSSMCATGFQVVTLEEKEQIISALNLGAGHWYKCKNCQYPFAIANCGGAVTETRCPGCRKSIGGRGHALNDQTEIDTSIVEGSSSQSYFYENFNRWANGEW